MKTYNVFNENLQRFRFTLQCFPIQGRSFSKRFETLFKSFSNRLCSNLGSFRMAFIPFSDRFRIVRIVFRLFRSVFELFSRNSSHFQTFLHLHAPIVTDARQDVQFQGPTTRRKVKRRVLSVPIFWTFGIFFGSFSDCFGPFSNCWDCFPNIFGISLDSRMISHENL